MSLKTGRKVWVVVDEAGELAVVAAFPTYSAAVKEMEATGFPAKYVRTATLTLGFTLAPPKPKRNP